VIPRTSVTSVEWPAVPSPAGSVILSLLHQLQESEWLAPKELERLQMEALGRLLRHACETVPYYRDRPAYTELANRPRISLREWAHLPVLTRDDVHDAGDALLSERVPPDHQPLAETFTSGTTDMPVRTVGTRVTALFWMAITLREQIWHGRDMAGRLAAIRAEGNGRMPEAGMTIDGWGPAIEAVYETGPCELFSIQRGVEEQATWLRRHDPDYLLTCPSNLSALAQHFQARGMRLARLRQVCSYGELLRPDVRAACEAAWGVRVVDLYSTQELGYLALQCPRGEQYHLQAESVLVEVLDGRGRRRGAGKIGSVVASGLHNYAMPLLRYDVGDYAEVGEDCACGRGLPVLSRIMGRHRNALVRPSGQKVWPTLSSKTWSHIEAVRQLQLVQHQPDHIEARVIGPRPLTEAEEADLADVLRARIGHPVELSFTYLERIDRSASPRFEDFISLVET
jgi:phenylacetate-CoA ligase